MTTVPTRFAAFDELALATLQAALCEYATSIMEDAAAAEIEPADLPNAAATFRIAQLLLHEIDDQLGHEHPSADSVDLVAGVIAAGEAPETHRVYLAEAAGS